MGSNPVSVTMQINETTRKILLVVAVIVLLFFVFYPRASGVPEDKKTAENPFKNIELEAKSAVVFDYFNNKPIFELNPGTQLPLASLTKIMTIIVAKESMPENDFEKISKNVNRALVVSSNEDAAAVALDAEKFLNGENFIDEMNKKADELNLNQTYFINETGLDINKNVAGAYGSAENVIKLLDYAIKNDNDIFEQTTMPDKSGTNPYATTTTLLVASKTGFTDLAGGNLAIVFEGGMGRPFGIVVLGSSKEGRFSDSQKLIDATFNYLKIEN
jgi:D-alanyl-D-alanine carboxypeptidase